MNGITHRQAVKWIHRRLDGLLNERQLLLLDEHLGSCDSCRAYAARMDLLPARLQNEFHVRWDEKPGPSQKVMEHVTTKARRIPMARRISSGLKLFAGAAALIAMAFFINLVLSQLQNTSTAAMETETADNSPLAGERLLAFTSEQNGNFDIYTMHTDGSGLTNLTNNPASDLWPAWTPDGGKIAFISDRTGNNAIFLMNADGSGLIQLTDNLGYVGNFSWSPDGQKIIYSSSASSDPNNSENQLIVMNPDGSAKTPLTDEPGFYVFLSWSPDSQKILYQKQQTDVRIEDAGIYLQDLAGNKAHTWLTSYILEQIHWEDLQYFYGTSMNDNASSTVQSIYQFNTNGEAPQIIASHSWQTPIAAIFEKTYIAESGGALRWYPLNNSRTSLATQTFRTLCEQPQDQNSVIIQDTSHVISPGGDQAFVTIRCNEGITRFYIENADGSEFKPLTDFVATGQQIAYGNWSPDGKYVSVTIGSKEGDSADLYLFDIEKMLKDSSTKPIPLTTDSARKYGAVWQPVLNNEVVEEKPTPEPTQVSSPDGLIAFASTQNGNSDIYTMHTDGSGVTNLTNNPAGDYSPIWSPDGKRFAFVSERDGNENIYVMNANGSNPTRLTDDPASDLRPIWSPDSTKIAYASIDPGGDTANIYVVDLSGENRRQLTNAVSGTAWPEVWSPDGQYFFFEINRQIIKVNVNNGDTTPVTPQEDDPSYFVLTKDGSELLYLDLCIQNSDEFCYQAKTIHGTSAESRATLQLQQVCKSETSYAQLAKWSPDRTKILFAFDCEENGGLFYIANADGSAFKPLTNYPILYDASGFDWSPDSRSIIFTSALDYPAEASLYVLDINDTLRNPSLRPTRLNTSASQISTLAWQPVSNNEVVEEKPTPEPTQTAGLEKFPPISTGKSNGEWIALVGFKEAADPGDPAASPMDVYMVHPDGSGLSNVTNSPARYFNLEWSPDGRHLIFLRENSGDKIDMMRHAAGTAGAEVITRPISDPDHYGYSWSPDGDKIIFADSSSGNYDIYTQYADGRDDPQLRQLTNDPGQDVGFAWSPDGSQIAFQRKDGEQLSILVMDADGSNQHEVARGMGEVRLLWSMDGKSIYANSIYLGDNIKNSHLECETCVRNSAIYRIDLDGPSVHQIHYEQDASKVAGWVLYDTPQNILYFMRINDETASVRTWGTWMYADGNSVSAIDEMDPHQTCKATTGNILNEHISPNKRFSIISNSCAGGFDLYLADRETQNPEQRLVHLLRLPPETLGQGGDFATIPMTWSPDGRWLVYDDGRATIYLLDLENAMRDPTTQPSALIQPTPDSISVFDLVWQPAP